MSDILNEALLAQIKRLSAINFEGISESISRLENASIASTKGNEEVVQKLQNISIPGEIKVTRHLTIGANDKYFLAFLFSTFLFFILTVGAGYYAFSKRSELEKANTVIVNQGAFIEWMNAEKTREKTLKKYIDETNARNNKK